MAASGGGGPAPAHRARRGGRRSARWPPYSVRGPRRRAGPCRRRRLRPAVGRRRAGLGVLRGGPSVPAPPRRAAGLTSLRHLQDAHVAALNALAAGARRACRGLWTAARPGSSIVSYHRDCPALLNFASGGPCFRTETSILRRQQPHRRAGPARPRRRPGSAGRGSPAPAGSAVRLHQRARHPALNHLAAAPLDPPRVTLNAAHQVLDDVRRAQSTERPRQTEPLHRQRLIEALPDGRRRARVVALQ